MMKYILLILAILTLSSCKESESVEVTFPVTDICISDSMEKIQGIMSDAGGFGIKYTEFDYKLDSHREIQGYVTLTSNHHTGKDDLAGYFNAVQSHCHTTKRAVVQFGELDDTMQFHNPETAYIKLVDGKYELWFK